MSTSIERVPRKLAAGLGTLIAWALYSSSAMAQTAPCSSPAWSSAAVYTAGNRVTHQSAAYEAKWWTQNENPATRSGEWDVWRKLQDCTGGANQPPTANAGPDRSVSPGAAVSLQGSGTDSDGSIASYRWTQTSGPTVTLNGATSATATFTAPQVTTSTSLTFRLTVTDNLGATGTDDVTVVVSTGNTGGGGKQVGSYFTQWGIYGRNYHVKNIETSGAASRLTFINYAFGNVYDDGRCNIITRAESGNGDGGDGYADYQKSYDAATSVDGVGDTWDQPLKGNFNQLKKLKARNPQIKLFISLGGWTWSKNFSRFSMTAAQRQTMASSCIDLYLKGNLPVADGAGGVGAAAGVFDGIDIDWEYPGGGGQPYNTVSPQDKANFTLLLAEFRRQLSALTAQTGRQYYLTIAAGAGADKIDNTEPGAYSQHLDWINLMTYDYHGGWEAQGPTNFQSNLYMDPNNPATGVVKTYATETTINKLLAAGVPASKLMVGIPYYGRGWTGVASGGTNGLYQPASGPARGTYEQGIEDYKVLAPRNAPKFYHPVTKQLWTYNGTEFWSFDDATVIATKAAYVKSLGLGGLFSWSLDGDDANATLTKEIAKVRN
ncbi:glycosyl hydrolase family 18 protein [Steroidobacter cummioxidans]|uniref:glycosyl hydrolase family 18 protein n=1 Tax=Steroidobacter cummioxidans TaxID=1803913 RepID=UPI0019D42D02|nr:glycosyl hydrolase family 18 protein [Steroidobacter cummioxidans]